MFTKILIANRGEIACRIIKTAHQMGIKTVAVYSDADKDARHVAMADEAFYLGGSAPSESYLKGELIIDIAKRSKAEAIHPGYGFLSENAPFARQCEQAGVVFIGPNSDAIEAMGSKSAAKLIMEQAKVPLVPGYHGDDQTDATLLKASKSIGFPQLIKAAYGGGGKGMHIVGSEDEALTAIQSARREAASSFGNDKLLIERYLQQPRHIEVQIFADNQGNCIYLSDRDCSIQRRHQKVVEEAPAPGLSHELRRTMGQAAVAAAKAINYVGAGTVEFLLDSASSKSVKDASTNFYFMEMNTRLQVEHPITEMVTSLDLVKWQLMIASGCELPLTQTEVHISGHAFEARIYAEDPQHDFLPASGKINFLKEPEQNQHIRIDSGVREQDVISNFYDPMIAKLIVWDESRPQALQRLVNALSNYQLSGLKNNIRFLSKISGHPSFAANDFSTDFIERYYDSLLNPVQSNSDDSEPIALAALYLICAQKQQAKLKAQNSMEPNSPWGQASGFRLNRPAIYPLSFLDINEKKEEGKSEDRHNSLSLNKENGDRHNSFSSKKIQHIDLVQIDQSYQLDLNGQKFTLNGQFIGDQLIAEINGHKQKLTVSQEGEHFTLFLPSGCYHYQTIEKEFIEEHNNLEDKLKAPMNGTIVTHLVNVGDSVTRGQGLMVMEAMKMEYTIEAPFAGTVTNFFFETGELVNDGALLLELIEEPSADKEPLAVKNKPSANKELSA